MFKQYKIVTYSFLNEATANGNSLTVQIPSGDRTVEAFITGTGTVSATITWYGCNTNRNTNGKLLATTTLSGTTSDGSGGVVTESWPYMYCVLSAISGTGAKVTATVGN